MKFHGCLSTSKKTTLYIYFMQQINVKLDLVYTINVVHIISQDSRNFLDKCAIFPLKNTDIVLSRNYFCAMYSIFYMFNISYLIAKNLFLLSNLGINSLCLKECKKYIEINIDYHSLHLNMKYSRMHQDI